MLPQILYVLQEAGATVSVEEIITKVQELGEGKLAAQDDYTQSLAVMKALDQGVQFGFITSDRRRQTFKLNVNYLRFENYHFNNKLRTLSEEFSLHGITQVFESMERYLQSDISDDSTEYDDSVAYDSDDERTPTPKKKATISKESKFSKLRKKRIFAAGATPKKLPRKDS
ncbi:uncharacterized protein LOC118514138 [Anopheles stephensi]|uniref:uncharacterized protein LOC118514138 n=1 Tax=Anopheles stephensi TaxID=30069 RepID=UPI001658B7D4|nr:uncharacterized protein LOC118514138 [Anopheles stephensi]